MPDKIVATLRNVPGQKIDLLRYADGDFCVQAIGVPGIGALGSVRLKPDEFIALLRAGLDELKVESALVAAVLPKLTRANVVR